MAESGGIYSLLGQATTAQYRKDKREERKYRRDFQRDQLKASLLGAVLNPLAQSITQGISTGIANKFGSKYENWKLNTEDMYDLERDKKLAKKNFTALELKDSEIKNSGLSMQEYYHQNIAPDYLAENMDEVLKQRHKSDLASKDSVFKKGILGALSRERYKSGDTAGFDAWVARFNAYRAGEISAPAQLTKYETAAKKKFPGGIFGSFYNWIIGKSPESIEAEALKLQTQNPVIKSLNRLQDLNDTYARENIVDLEELNTILTESKVKEDYKRRNQAVVSSSTEVDGDVKSPTFNLLKEVEISKVTYPFGIINEEGTLVTESTIEMIKIYDSKEKLRAATLKGLQDSNSWRSLYKQLSAGGEAAFVESAGGQEKARQLIAQANSNWTRADGTAMTVEEILAGFKPLVALFATDAGQFTSEKLDTEMQLRLGNLDLFVSHMETVDEIWGKADKAVDRGDYKTSLEALTDLTTPLGKEYQLWQEQWSVINNDMIAARKQLRIAQGAILAGEAK